MKKLEESLQQLFEERNQKAQFQQKAKEFEAQILVLKDKISKQFDVSDSVKVFKIENINFVEKE